MKPHYKITITDNSIDESQVRAWIKEHWWNIFTGMRGPDLVMTADCYMIAFGFKLLG